MDDQLLRTIAQLQNQKAEELRRHQDAHAQELQQQQVGLAEDRGRLAPLAQQHTRNLSLIEAKLNNLSRQMPSLMDIFRVHSVRGLIYVPSYPSIGGTNRTFYALYIMSATKTPSGISISDKAEISRESEIFSGYDIAHGPLAELVLRDEYVGNESMRSALYAFRTECFQLAEQLLDDAKLGQVIVNLLENPLAHG